jgi:hypothetical protein
MDNSVRKLAVDVIRTRLGNITTDNGYSKDVGPERVFAFKDSPNSMPTPCVIIMQGDEEIEKEYSRLYECYLELYIGFAETFSGEDPDEEAVKFMSDIQKAMGIEFEVTAKGYNSEEDTSTTVQLKEIGSMINVSESIPGLLLGQVIYVLRYRRRIEDPTKV